jgi:NADH-quinone oxidoreductase subunit J
MRIEVILVIALVLSAMATVMAARLIRAVIGLGLTSVIVAVLMFRLNSPIAAVFELSVCAGLIPAIFITSIGLTRRLTPEALADRQSEKLKRFRYLPFIVVLVGLALSQMGVPTGFAAPSPGSEQDVRIVLWMTRHADLLGQIVVLIGAVFSVVVLVKEPRHG